MNIIKSALSLCLLLIFSANLIAQNSGRITGTVVDSQTGETLIGVNVVIDGTIKGTATDIDGRYSIRNVEPGTYTIVVSYLSFATQTITGVVIGSGETVTLDIILQPETEFLEEIVVTADVVLNNEAGLLRQRQKSIAFSDAISSQFISKSGAGDAAAALTKVTGASVVGGKYVYVRGLGDRYSSIQMNGVELPSTDPDRKTFQLDLIPSSLLENINTVKTFTPDKPGSFSGGIVDINTKEFPSELELSVSTSLEYNTQSTLIDNFISDEVSSREWLAFDDGNRDIPDIFNDPDLIIPSVSAARSSDSLTTIINETSRAFNENMLPQERNVPVNYGYSFALGNRATVLGKELGYIASVTYSRNYSFYDNGFTGRYNLTDPSAVSLTALQEYQDRTGTDEVNIGGVLGMQIKLSETQKVGFTYFKTQSGTNTARIQEGTWPDELGFPEEGAFQQRTNTVVGYRERDLDYLQFTGEHFFENFLDIKFDWTASFAETNQGEPDLRFVSFFANQNTAVSDTNLVIRTAGFSFPSRLFRELNERNDNVSANIEIPLKLLTTQDSKFKFGGSYRIVDRTFRERYFFIEPSQQIYSNGFSNDTGGLIEVFNPVDPTVMSGLDGDISRFFDQVYRGDVAEGSLFNRNTRTIDTVTVFGNIVDDNTLERNNYNADTEISAFYAMLELPVTERLKIIGGVRYESADLNVVSFDTSSTIIDGELVRPGQGSISNEDWLPAINVIYSLNDRSNLRAAWAKTIARPTSREIAPFSSFDFIGDFLKQGNPELERTLITNYDIRYEIFPRPGEVFALSLFYKDLENPIELGFRPGAIATNAILQWQNVEKAEIRGLEFEVRKNLDFISDLTKDLSIGANLSLIDSNIDIPAEELAQRPDSTITTRELQGQSPYIVNVNFGYDNLDNGLSLGFYYNVFGQRLSNVGFGLNPDVYEQPRPQLDFTGSKDFKKIQLSLKVRNILDSLTSFEFDFRDNNEVFQSYRTGVSFSIGVKYNI